MTCAKKYETRSILPLKRQENWNYRSTWKLTRRSAGAQEALLKQVGIIPDLILFIIILLVYIL